jgi:hypothetical protein
MLIEINRSVLEQLVKDKEYMYTVITNWTTEITDHSSWWGLGLRYNNSYLRIRPRGATQISIKYENRTPEYSLVNHIEKRIIKYKKL